MILCASVIHKLMGNLDSGMCMCDRVAKYQYYVLGNTHRSSGNPTHSFGTEEQLLKALAQQNFITVCNDLGCTGKSSPHNGIAGHIRVQ